MVQMSVDVKLNGVAQESQLGVREPSSHQVVRRAADIA